MVCIKVYIQQYKSRYGRDSDVIRQSGELDGVAVWGWWWPYTCLTLIEYIKLSQKTYQGPRDVPVSSPCPLSSFVGLSNTRYSLIVIIVIKRHKKNIPASEARVSSPRLSPAVISPVVSIRSLPVRCPSVGGAIWFHRRDSRSVHHSQMVNH